MRWRTKVFSRLDMLLYLFSELLQNVLRGDQRNESPEFYSSRMYMSKDLNFNLTCALTISISDWSLIILRFMSAISALVDFRSSPYLPADCCISAYWDHHRRAECEVIDQGSSCQVYIEVVVTVCSSPHFWRKKSPKQKQVHPKTVPVTFTMSNFYF